MEISSIFNFHKHEDVFWPHRIIHRATTYRVANINKNIYKRSWKSSVFFVRLKSKLNACPNYLINKNSATQV